MEKCKVCGKKYKKITSSHVGTHSLTMDEYNSFELSDKDDVKDEEIEVIDEKIENEITEEENVEVIEEVTPDIEYWILNPDFRDDDYCLKCRTEDGGGLEMFITKDSKFELPKRITTNIQMAIKRHIIIRVVE